MRSVSLGIARPSPAERPPSGSGEAHHTSITPHSPISLSPSSSVCMCVYTYVSVCVCVCVHVWQSCEKRREWADTGRRLHIFSKLQYPNCKVSLIYLLSVLRVGECAYWKLHRRETTRSARSQQSLRNSDVHHFIYTSCFLSSLKMKVNIDENHSDLNNH